MESALKIGIVLSGEMEVNYSWISDSGMCLINYYLLQGLTEKFKEKDTAYMGSATFTYEAFMLTVLPFLIA